MWLQWTLAANTVGNSSAAVWSFLFCFGWSLLCASFARFSHIYSVIFCTCLLDGNILSRISTPFATKYYIHRQTHHTCADIVERARWTNVFVDRLDGWVRVALVRWPLPHNILPNACVSNWLEIYRTNNTYTSSGLYHNQIYITEMREPFKFLWCVPEWGGANGSWNID